MYKYTNYDALIFDLGNTIWPIAPHLTIEAFCKLGLEENIFNPSEDMQIILSTYQKGMISSREFLLSIQRQCPKDIEIGEIILAWNTMLLDFPVEHFRLLEKLKKSHEIILLSNTNSLHQVCFEGKSEKAGYAFRMFFDKTFYSHIIRKSKPNAEIYVHVQENANLAGKRVLFLDDLAENLIEPKRIGWDVVQVSEGKSILDFQ